MIPVGTALAQGELISKGFARWNTIEADTRHAIHAVIEQDAMPVNGRGFAQAVGYADGNGVAFTQAQGRCRNRAVDGRRFAHITGEVHQCFFHYQIYIGAADNRCRAMAGSLQAACIQPVRHGAEHATGGKPLDKTAATDAAVYDRCLRFRFHKIHFLTLYPECALC